MNAEISIESVRQLLDKVRALKEDPTVRNNPSYWAMVEGFLSALSTMSAGPVEPGEPEYKQLEKSLERCSNAEEPNSVKQMAAMELGELGWANSSSAVAALTGLLQHKDKRVRINACQSLGRIGTAEAKKQLSEVLRSADPETANSAKYALQHCRVNALCDEFEQIRQNNFGFTQFLSKRHSAQIVFLYSSCFLLAAVAAFAVWRDFKIYIMHPSISLVIGVVSIGLMVLSVWRSSKCS